MFDVFFHGVLWWLFLFTSTASKVPQKKVCFQMIQYLPGSTMLIWVITCLSGQPVSQRCCQKLPVSFQ